MASGPDESLFFAEAQSLNFIPSAGQNNIQAIFGHADDGNRLPGFAVFFPAIFFLRYKESADEINSLCSQQLCKMIAVDKRPRRCRVKGTLAAAFDVCHIFMC